MQLRFCFSFKLTFLLILLPFNSASFANSWNLRKEISYAYFQEISLYNATDKVVVYKIKPLVEDVPPRIKSLPPGESELFPESTHLEIVLLPEESGFIYWLFSGESYVVKELDDKGPRVFKKNKLVPDAFDLAPFVASPMPIVERMLEVAGVTEDSRVYDLGCGDGRVVITAARKYGAKGVGIDIDPDRIAKAEKNAVQAGVTSLVEFRCQDIFAAEISDATVVYLYLYLDSNLLLRPFLEKNLQAGTIVACLSFYMPGWQDKLITTADISTENGATKTIFVYRR